MLTKTKFTKKPTKYAHYEMKKEAPSTKKLIIIIIIIPLFILVER